MYRLRVTTREHETSVRYNRTQMNRVRQRQLGGPARLEQQRGWGFGPYLNKTDARFEQTPENVMKGWLEREPNEVLLTNDTKRAGLDETSEAA